MAYGRGNLLWTTLPPIDMASKADKRREKEAKRERERSGGGGTTTALIMRQVFAAPRLVSSLVSA